MSQSKPTLGLDAYASKRPMDPPTYRDAMYVPSRDTLGRGALGPQPYKPVTLRTWVVAVIVITLIGLSVALEVALAISNKNGGYAVGERNVLTGISPRFLTAFIPTFLVAGLLIIWQSSDRSYRELQPYVVLARGNVTAAEGLLANYSGLSVWGVIATAVKFRHYLILLSTATTLLGAFLQPLAGSILQLVMLPKTTDGLFITSTKTIGLTFDVAELNAFLAAAGYAEAAVFHGLSDPPFVHGGWAVAEFQFPSDAVLNGTLSVNTTAIQTMANCEAAQTNTLLSTTPGNPNFTIQATNSAGCAGMATFNPDSSASTQYGTVAVPNCGSNEIDFMPIMFWFFHRKDDDQTPESASVFCNPTIKALNVMADVDLSNKSITAITTLDSVTSSNNVTGDPLKGQAYNAVKFTPNNNDSFVSARATSIAAGVSGSIFRFALQSTGGVQPKFDDPNGFLNITLQVFTQHLSISAKSIYFISAQSKLPARVTALAPRLWIDPTPAHALAVILTLIGLSALLLHIVHSRQRRRFFLSASPGSIAHIISMTAHARFGEQLYPYDDDETLARKLAGLSFSLDPRTGAVVADRDVGPVQVPLGAVTPFRAAHSRGGSEVSVGTGRYTDDGYSHSQTALLLPPSVDEKHGRPSASPTPRGTSLSGSSHAHASLNPSPSPTGWSRAGSSTNVSGLGLSDVLTEVELHDSNSHRHDVNSQQLPQYSVGASLHLVPTPGSEKRGARGRTGAPAMSVLGSDSRATTSAVSAGSSIPIASSSANTSSTALPPLPPPPPPNHPVRQMSTVLAPSPSVVGAIQVTAVDQALLAARAPP
ncbi:hypothetical protein C8R43DRAFT_82654 [Mycena crocata]|nr:hypothetical protein C8R43DRAFT_82654 [Mycena crocata]